MRIRLLTSCILLLIFLSHCSDQRGGTRFEEIIQTQLQRYPQMQIEDLYKLIHQAAMGNIHLGVDPTILKNYLTDEMARIESVDEEPLIEDISPKGMIRLNLRPFKAKGGDPEKLFEAMMKTADTFQPEKMKINEYWKIIGKMADSGLIPFSKNQLDSFFVKMQEQEFPAIHHSEEYSQAYYPAYRVVLKEFLPQLD